MVKKAASENDIVVTSIFVNPTQFGPNEDLDKYPRTWDHDLKVLTDLECVDLIFAPTNMYSENHITYVDPSGSYFDDLPEAKVRPGHFRGVATVVNKLFNIVQPNRAYFGQKDAAQCVLIRRMVEDLNMDIEVVIGDTVREEDGLAMSSRNAYLTTEERASANVLYRSLCAARSLHQNSTQKQDTSSELTVAQLRKTTRSVLEEEPLVKEIQYIAIDDYDTMRPLDDGQILNKGDSCIISLACQVGQVRLIDNIVLKP